MSEEILKEENPLNPEEGQPTEEKPNSENREFTENEKRQYARAKKAEEEARQLRDKLKSLLEEKDEKPEVLQKPELSAFELARQVKVLSEFNEQELTIISDFAKARGISEMEAAKLADVNAIIGAVREKIKNENLTPRPSTKQSLSDKTAEQIIQGGRIKELSIDDKAELIKKYNQEKNSKRVQ